jgi:hypothetical protein
MQPAFEPTGWSQRRALLQNRWLAEERRLAAALNELQSAYDRDARSASDRIAQNESLSPSLLHYYAQLLQERDDAATELLHVRLALQGLALQEDDPAHDEIKTLTATV